MGTTQQHAARAGPTSLWSFAGAWRLDRDIRHKDGTTDRFTGKCLFSKSGMRLVQDETGYLETAGARFEATRRYVWTETNGRLDVYFDGMRPFHSVPLGAERPETLHICPPDRYHVAYDFSTWPEWKAVWTVEGPRKGYRMVSSYAPQLASP